MKILFYSLLACKVFAEKSAGSLMGIPLYVTSCFSLDALKILSLFFFSLSLFLTVDILMCLGVDLLGFILLRSF